MEQPDNDKSPAATGDAGLLNRNRSFKSKQLVRSQAIRESHSPPRTSPLPPGPLDNTDNRAIITSDVAVSEKYATGDAGDLSVNKNAVATSRAVSSTIPPCVTKMPDTSPSVSPTLPSCATKIAVVTSVTNRAVSPTDPVCVTKSASEVVTPAACVTKNAVIVKVVNIDSDRTLEKASETSSQGRQCGGVNERGDGKQSVEIQMGPGVRDWQRRTSARARTSRWLHSGPHSDDLLSNNPRVSCVCENCPHCRGARMKASGPSKQDSGFGAGSDDWPDCDTEPSGGSCEGVRKTRSMEYETTEHTCRCSDRKEQPKNINLSRNDSAEDYTKQELHGKELINFIKHTLNKNSRDRMTMLKIEKELHMLVNDTGRSIVRFPVMSSYGRLLVHRCAALFQLAHHLDPSNKTCVLVSKNGTSGGRIPCTSFKSWCTVNFPASPHHTPQDATQAKSILKRDALSLDETSNGANDGANSRSKSLEQREKEYERVRRRIFSTDNCTSDEAQWPWLTGQVKVLTPEPGSRKLLKVQSLEVAGGPSNWRRARVSKSHSFGGLGGDEPARLLSRQGDLASSSWRLSPSSSGYKTLSLRSTDSVTPSPTGGVSPEPGVTVSGVTEAPLVWCVTDLSSIPHGALIIHPQSGQPLTNPDGSVYRYDPTNPPGAYDPPDAHNKVEQSEDKRRGRLEKQHSFIHAEYECPGEECRTKGCYCECDRETRCPNNVSDKINIQSIQQPEPIQQQPPPTSHYQPEPPANHSAPPEPPTNQTAAYDAAANHAPFEPANQNQGYVQYRNEEELQQITSPQVLPSYVHSESSYVHTEPPMVKTTPVPDPNLSAPPPALPYYPLYPAAAHKPPAFRIDSSYPYAPVEPYASFAQPCAAACPMDPNTLHHRGYQVSYAQLDPALQASMSAAYPVGNVIPPLQYPAQAYQQLQWVPAAAHKPASPPVYLTPEMYQHQLYPVQYQYYQQPSGVYQQMAPQYQICQPVYLPDNSARRSVPPRPPSVPSARLTPRPAPPAPRPPPRASPPGGTSSVHRNEASLSRQNSSELAMKIQQIKEQMAALNTQDSTRDKPERSSSRHERRPQEDQKGRRNNGSGLLGSYPAGGGYHSRSFGRPPINDESQLSTAARAIVDSIRNMQTKNPISEYHDNRRSYEHHNKNYHNRSENYQNRSENYQHRPENYHNRSENYHNRSENYHNRTENYHNRSENYQNRTENYQNGRNRQNQPENEQKPEEKDVKPIEDVVFTNVKTERPGQARIDPSVLSRHRPVNPVAPFPYRQPCMMRQMPPGTWCRRSPGPVPPHLNGPRRPPPDSRPHRRQ